MAATVTQDRSMTRQYLSTTEIAKMLGVTQQAFTSLKSKPKPDVIVGVSGGKPTYGWSKATIERWIAARDAKKK